MARSAMVGPWIQKRNAGCAAFGSSGFKILQPPQEFLAPVSERSAQHASTWQKNRLQLSRDKFVLAVGHVLFLAE
jgi:hypothetical protein